MGFLDELKEDVRCEISGLVLIALGILGITSLASPSSGILSELLEKMFKGIAGEGCYLPPLILILAGIRLLVKRTAKVSAGMLYGIITLLVVLLSFFHMIIPLEDAVKAGINGDGGGLLGALVSYSLRKAFGQAGACIVLCTAIIIAVLVITGMSLSIVAEKFFCSLSALLKKIIAATVNFLFTEEKEQQARHGEQETAEEKRATYAKESECALGARSIVIKEPESGDSEPEGSNVINKAGDECINRLAVSSPGSNSWSEFADAQDDEGGLPSSSMYKLPPISLLSRPHRQKSSKLGKDITENIKILEETLESFGVKAKVIQVSRGPAITRYEIQPPAGVKVSRIVSLADDIALSMAAPGVRIEAPIPGKAAVGIEVPNKEISTVHLRELLETQEFIQSKSKLTVALGKDIAGNPVVADLAKMHHILIAGATGSGKSVCLNTLIASILFKATPSEVKFLMIDPKMVELTTFNGIPHLVSPVVTDPKKAAGSLRWAVREMERRYELFAASGVRDITRHNRLFAKNEGRDGEPLPLLVIIIDELADLMMVAPADVEDAVCRLAQMARAAGIHLVVATQRPSVDVITGLIKANIPSRISFAVSSQVDSRTILDMAGAEKLLGKGDMLFFPVGASKPKRVQGAYLSDREVEELVSYLKKQAEPVYDEGVMADEPKTEEKPAFEDELLPQAVQILIEAGHASISMLQRRLHIGYARAARLIDIMEKKGIVGGYEGSKPRAVLMTMEQYQKIFRTRQ